MSETPVTLDRSVVTEEDEADLTTWLQPTGASVQAGDPIAEVTASKALIEIAAPSTGRLRHLVEQGAALRPGQTIAVIEADS